MLVLVRVVPLLGGLAFAVGRGFDDVALQGNRGSRRVQVGQGQQIHNDLDAAGVEEFFDVVLRMKAGFEGVRVRGDGGGWLSERWSIVLQLCTCNRVCKYHTNIKLNMYTMVGGC